MSEIYPYILMPVIYVFEGICANILFRESADMKTGDHRALKYLPGSLWAVYETAVYFVFDSKDGMDMLFTLTLCVAAMCAFSVLMNRGSFLKRIFPAVLFISIRELAAEGTHCLTGLGNFVSDIITKKTIDGTIPLEYYSVVFYTSYYSILSITCAARIAVIYITVRKLTDYGCRQDNTHETKFLLIPALAALLTNAMIKMLLVTLENGYTVIIYSRYPLLYILVPTLSLTFLSAILLTFRQYRKITELQTDKAERMLLESQIKQLRTSLSETEQLYDNIRSARHDMRNNMTVLKAMLDRKCPDDKDLTHYFKEMCLSVERLESRVRTGNAVCDSIISGKFRLAEKLIPDIKLNGDDFIFSSVNIRSYDIGIILSNALDNAVEACCRLKEKEPQADCYIKLRSFKKRNLFFVEIENSFDGTLKPDSRNGLFLSLKDEPELHGIGLRSIRSCAEKYSGGIDIIADGNKFILSVMMKEDKNVNENS